MSSSLPLLNRSEIIHIMSEKSIMTVSDTDLQKPTSSFAFSAYSTLLSRLFTEQEDQMVDFTALDRFDNPDMHYDSVRVINLLGKIKSFLNAIECPVGFTLNDLLCPDSHRTLLFLSAFLNFYLYRDSKLEQVSPIMDELASLDEQRREKENHISELREEIARIREANESERPYLQVEQSKVNELRQTLDNLNNIQANLRNNLKAMSNKSKDIKEDINRKEYELVLATEENSVLRSRIVQSPDKLQSALEEKKAVLVEAKNSERLAMQRFQEKTATSEVYSKAWEKMTKQYAQMLAIQEQMSSLKDVEKDLKQVKTEISTGQMDEKKLEAKIIECEAKAEQCAEHKSQLEKEANLRRKESTKELGNVKLQADLRKNNLHATEKNIEALLSEADATREKIRSEKESAAATQQELLQRAEEVVKEFKFYSMSIEEGMEAAVLPC